MPAEKTPVRLTAATADGIGLPVLDVTNPAFAIRPGAAEIEAMTDRFIAGEERRSGPSRLLQRLMLAVVGRRSLLIRAIAASRDSFLTSIPTYVLKLGPDNLVPPYDTPIDRIVVATAQAISLRLRTEQVARLLAEALVPELGADRQAPLVLINIAGGPAMDSLNALILLGARGLLAGRTARIWVLDLDPAGPTFGGNALRALQQPGAPLAGLDIAFEPAACRWQELDRIAALLDDRPEGAVLAVSSEGGLFDYGSDAEVIDVLKLLLPRVAIVAGSASASGRAGAAMRRANRTQVVPRGAAGLRALAVAAGYAVAEVRSAPFSDQLLLRRP